MIFTKTKESKPAGRGLTDVDADLLAWRSRREQLAQDLEDAKAREQSAVDRRGQLTAELVPDAAEVKKARASHAAAVAEREEIELAIGSVDERLRNLDAERAQAERRRLITAALASLDRVGAIASRLDDDWDRIRAELERFIHAADDAAGVLRTACPGNTFALNPDRLRGALLWRIGDLINLGFVGAPERISAVELVSWGRLREQLEHELTDQKGASA